MFLVIRSYKNAYMMHTCRIEQMQNMGTFCAVGISKMSPRQQENRKTFLHFSFKGCCHEMWICICNSENILTISSFFVNNKFVSAGNYRWLPFVSNKDRKRLQIEKLSSSFFELIIVSSFENYPVGVAVAPFLRKNFNKRMTRISVSLTCYSAMN